MEFYTSACLHRGKLLLRGYKDGERFIVSETFKPHVFIGTKDQNTKYRTITGKPVKRLEFATRKEEREFLDKYSDVQNFDIYGFTGALNMYAHLNERYPGLIEYDPNLIRIVNIDIETRSDQGFPDVASADMDITAITVGFRGKYFVFGLKEFDNKTPDHVRYFQCEDEEMLLRKFLVLMERIDPDVITGWNIEQFDIPYLYNRITVMCGKKHADRLSPHGVVLPKKVKVKEYEVDVYDLLGVSQLDYMVLYKKFSFKDQASFSLDNISLIELKEQKLAYAGARDIHTYLTGSQKVTYDEKVPFTELPKFQKWAKTRDKLKDEIKRRRKTKT